MKGIVLLMSVICAAALGALSYILATGHIPLRPPPEQATVMAGVSTGATETAVSFKEKEVIEALIRSLREERADLEAKRAAPSPSWSGSVRCACCSDHRPSTGGQRHKRSPLHR